MADKLSGKGKKDAGKVKIRYPGFDAQKGTAFSPVRIAAEFEIAEVGGRSVATTVKTDIFPTDFFIGLRKGENKDGKANLEYTLLPALKQEETILKDKFEITFEILKNEWIYVLSGNGSRYSREWQKKVTPLHERKTVVTLEKGAFKTGKIEQLLLDLQPGSYTICATAANSFKTTLDFNYYEGEGGTRSANPQTLYFKTDSEKTAPGGEVTFSFEAPGDGEAFIVFGEKELSSHRIIPVKAGRNDVKVTVPDNVQSASYFAGCTVVAKIDGIYHRSSGILEIKVDQTNNHRLKTTLDLPSSAEPEQEITVNVALSDRQGNPSSGTVCLYAVDSGVTSLTGYTAPDIFNYFYGPVEFPVIFSDMYGLIYENLKITPDGRIGGDASGFAAKLGKIKQKHTSRIIAPEINVPESGKASLKLRLPAHTCAMSFYAVASSENAVDSASCEITLKNTFTVTVSAPRYAAPGDEADIAVTVFNNDAGTSDYSCVVTLPDSLEAIDGVSNVINGKGLEKGTSKTHFIKVKAKDSFGAGTIKAELTAQDTKAKDECFITVRSVNIAQTAYAFKTLEPDENLSIDFTGDYTGNPSGTVTVSASPASAVKNALEWLNMYPYGCLEQTTSGAFPFVALDTLAKAGIINEKTADANRMKVAAGYAKILAMGLSDGSFSMWPGGNQPWDEASIFALHFVFEAEKKGFFKVSDKERSKYIDFLRRKANNASPVNRNMRAYATYVLAVAGDRSFVRHARNIIQGSKKSDYAMFLAGGALIKGGYATLGIQAVREALQAQCHLEENVPTVYSDNSCRLGMALYILMDCAVPDEELLHSIAFELAKSIRPDGSAWGTTHANAWASMGLAAYAGKFPPSPAVTEITLDGKTAETVRFPSSKTFENVKSASVKNVSNGKLFVETRICGIPKKTPPNGGKLILSKEYLNKDGERINKINHGDTVFVKIRFEAPEYIESVVIGDLLPSGLEIEDDQLETRAHNIPSSMASKNGNFHLKRIEKRDDRYLIFGNATKGKSEFVYRTRAVICGSFEIPPVQAEAMYNPELTGLYGNMGKLTVEAAK